MFIAPWHIATSPENCQGDPSQGCDFAAGANWGGNGWLVDCFLSCFIFLVVPIVVVAVDDDDGDDDDDDDDVIVAAAAFVGADVDVLLQLLVEGLFDLCSLD